MHCNNTIDLVSAFFFDVYFIGFLEYGKKLRAQYASLSYITEPVFKGESSDETFAFESTIRKNAMVEVCLVEGNVYHDELSMHNERSRHLNIIDKLKASKIDLKDLIVPESKLCYVRGIAGIGKSCLLDLIALKWADEEMLCDKDQFGFKLLFRFQLRDWNKYKGKRICVDDIFRDAFRIDIKRIEQEVSGENILVLFDGIDEYFEYQSLFANNKEDITTVLYDLVRPDSPIFPGHYTVIAGRPHAMNHLKTQQVKTGKARMVEIIGFTNEMVDNYLFRLPEPLRKQLSGKIKGSQVLKALCQVPLFIKSICDVTRLESSNGTKASLLNNISTVTDIYCCAFAAFLKYHFKPDGEDLSSSYLYDLFQNETVCNFLDAIGRISYELLLESSIIFEYEKIKDLAENPTLLKLVNAFVVQSSYRTCQFIHLSLQEFFAAYYCFNNQIPIADLLKRKLLEVVQFYAGFIKARQHKSNVESIKSWLVRETKQVSETFISDFVNAVFSHQMLLGSGFSYKVIFELFDASDKIPAEIKFPECGVSVECLSTLEILYMCHFATWMAHNGATCRLGTIDLRIRCDIDQKTFEEFSKHIGSFRSIEFVLGNLNVEFTQTLSGTVNLFRSKQNLALRHLKFGTTEYSLTLSEGAWFFFAFLIPLIETVRFNRIKLSRKLSSDIAFNWGSLESTSLHQLCISECTLEEGFMMELVRILPFIKTVTLYSLKVIN